MSRQIGSTKLPAAYGLFSACSAELMVNYFLILEKEEEEEETGSVPEFEHVRSSPPPISAIFVSEEGKTLITKSRGEDLCLMKCRKRRGL
jgi:hypothetical protein